MQASNDAFVDYVILPDGFSIDIYTNNASGPVHAVSEKDILCPQAMSGTIFPSNSIGGFSIICKQRAREKSYPNPLLAARYASSTPNGLKVTDG